MKTVTVSLIILLTAFMADAQKLQPVFSDNSHLITGVAISAKGRLFVTFPRWSDTYQYGVIEISKDGSAKPYPHESTNKWQPGEDGMDKWVCVQTAYIDDNDYLYIVDAAAPKLGKVYNGSAKVVKFDLNTDQVVKTYRFPGTIDNQSYLNDIRVDTKTQIAYLTNSGTGGIVVLDLNTGDSRQVLQGHRSFHPDPNVKFIIDGHELKKQGLPVAFQSDGIALSPDGVYLYYKTIGDKRLFRIKTAVLNDPKQSTLQLAAAVEDLGDFAHTDGMILDDKANLYLGDPTTYSIVKISPDLNVHTWIEDEKLIWPDTYAISKDGYMYIAASQVQRQPGYNDGVGKRTSPYMIYKTKLPESAQVIDPSSDPHIDSQVKALLKEINTGPAKPIEELPLKEARASLTTAQSSVKVDLSGITVSQKTITQDGLDIKITFVKPVGATSGLPRKPNILSQSMEPMPRQNGWLRTAWK